MSIASGEVISLFPSGSIATMFKSGPSRKSEPFAHFGSDRSQCIHTDTSFSDGKIKTDRCVNPVISGSHGWLCSLHNLSMRGDRSQIHAAYMANRDYDLELVDSIVSSETLHIDAMIKEYRVGKKFVVEAHRQLAPLSAEFINAIGHQWENVDLRPLHGSRE